MILSIFDNAFLTCELDDSLPVLKHRWKGEVTAGEFKNNVLKVLDHYVDLAKTYAGLAWLADTALLGEVDEETDIWLLSTWESLLFQKARVKIHAVILGASIYADYPMEKFKQHAEEEFKSHHVHLGVFSNERDAYHWIKQKQLTS
jgi:hypothetical protein